MVETTPLVVVKKDSSRQMFDRNKILSGLLRACEKRPVSLAKLEKAVDSIEQYYANSLVKEVSSVELGEKVLMELKELDPVAYIRFASVYREFSDIETFLSELKALKKEKKK